MKKCFSLCCATLILSGCAVTPHYSTTALTPPPQVLTGYWQTVGPQTGLISPEAQAVLIINTKGDTVDCRSWQRVLVKKGKVALIEDHWVNINQDDRVMPLRLTADELQYDKLVLHKVTQVDPLCLVTGHENHPSNTPRTPSRGKHQMNGFRNTKG